MNREEILEAVKRIICYDRNNEYGEPENNFSVITDFWNTYLHGKLQYDSCLEITGEDVGIMMTLFKIGRMTASEKDDNFLDGIGYLACAMECKGK